jgi:hypothetical protein
MRYYSILLSDPITGNVYQINQKGDGFTLKAGGAFTFASTTTGGVSGGTILGALNVGFDIPAAPFNQPQGQARLKIWGVGLNMISQSANFNPNPLATPYKPGANISISAGMQKGLPLANPAQAGLLVQGTVFQAWGNWQLTEQTLEFLFNPGSMQQNQQIQWKWPAGMPLATALQTTFQQAFSQYKLVVDPANITIAPDIQQASEESGTYDNIFQFAAYIQDRSQTIGAQTHGSDYSGVLITITGNSIFAYDSLNPRKTITLNFQDLIGQPTWVEPRTISFKTVLRSDIAIGNLIKFPVDSQGQPVIVAPYALTSQAAATPGFPARSQTAFQGQFSVSRVQHFANFRQADADSWVTAFEAVSLTT